MRRRTRQADTPKGANLRKHAGAFRLGHLQLASSQCPDQHALNYPWPDPMGPRKGLPTANSHLRQSARQRHQAPLGATALRLPATPPRRQLTALLRNAGGGGERDRTDDLLLAKQALSQLSYTPEI